MFCWFQEEPPAGAGVSAGQSGCGGEGTHGGGPAQEEDGEWCEWAGGSGGPAEQEQRGADEDREEDAAADQGAAQFTQENMLMYSGGEKMIWSPADFVRLPTDKEMISL